MNLSNVVVRCRLEPGMMPCERRTWINAPDRGCYEGGTQVIHLLELDGSPWLESHESGPGLVKATVVKQEDADGFFVLHVNNDDGTIRVHKREIAGHYETVLKIYPHGSTADEQSR